MSDLVDMNGDDIIDDFTDEEYEKMEFIPTAEQKSDMNYELIEEKYFD